jgi:hypothetical protein
MAGHGLVTNLADSSINRTGVSLSSPAARPKCNEYFLRWQRKYFIQRFFQGEGPKAFGLTRECKLAMSLLPVLRKMKFNLLLQLTFT